MKMFMENGERETTSAKMSRYQIGEKRQHSRNKVKHSLALKGERENERSVMAKQEKTKHTHTKHRIGVK